MVAGEPEEMKQSNEFTNLETNYIAANHNRRFCTKNTITRREIQENRSHAKPTGGFPTDEPVVLKAMLDRR